LTIRPDPTPSAVDTRENLVGIHKFKAGRLAGCSSVILAGQLEFVYANKIFPGVTADAWIWADCQKQRPPLA